MLWFDGPYTSLYMLERKKLYRKPTVLHHQTCPICDAKRVNLYFSSQLEKYICKRCMDKLIGNKEMEK